MSFRAFVARVESSSAGHLGYRVVGDAVTEVGWRAAKNGARRCRVPAQGILKGTGVMVWGSTTSAKELAMEERSKTGKTPSWAPPAILKGKKLTEELRARAQESVWQRVALLEKIADGQIGYRRVSKKMGAEMAEPTPKDRIAAIRLLAEMAGIFAKDEKALHAMGSDEQLANAMAAALRDPGVREWLTSDVELMSQLRGMVDAPVVPREAEPAEAEAVVGPVALALAPSVVVSQTGPIGLLDDEFANWDAQITEAEDGE